MKSLQHDDEQAVNLVSLTAEQQETGLHLYRMLQPHLSLGLPSCGPCPPRLLLLAPSWPPLCRLWPPSTERRLLELLERLCFCRELLPCPSCDSSSLVLLGQLRLLRL